VSPKNECRKDRKNVCSFNYYELKLTTSVAAKPAQKGFELVNVK
jgi:hypothetical protein